MVWKFKVTSSADSIVLVHDDDWETVLGSLIGSLNGTCSVLPSPTEFVPMTVRVSDTPHSTTDVVPSGSSVKVDDAECSGKSARSLSSLDDVLAVTTLVDLSVPALFFSTSDTGMFILPGDHGVSLASLDVVVMVRPLIRGPLSTVHLLFLLSTEMLDGGDQELSVVIVTVEKTKITVDPVLVGVTHMGGEVRLGVDLKILGKVGFGSIIEHGGESLVDSNQGWLISSGDLFVSVGGVTISDSGVGGNSLLSLHGDGIKITSLLHEVGGRGIEVAVVVVTIEDMLGQIATQETG